MELEARSKNLLAVTRSKAKMYEFGVEEEHHIDLPQNPENLLILTIGILGELSALEARRPDYDHDYYVRLKNQLATVGQYFDALNLSKVDPGLSTYLRLIGSSAYYLADMPGSSLVLANELDYNLESLTPSYIEGILVWLLKSDIEKLWYRFEKNSLTPKLDLFADTFKGYFRQQNDKADFTQIAQDLRAEIYLSGNDREVLFVDVMVSLALRKIENSSLNCLPKYTGIPVGEWQSALDKPTFIKEFWPAQKLLGEKGVLSGGSAVIQMPTSAGKTKSTELIIRSAFISDRVRLAVIIAPFRALCREISATFEGAFNGENVNVNELQDVTQISESEDSLISILLNEVLMKLKDQRSIIISTPEKFVYLLRHEPELAEKIGLLIFDEGHQFDTGKRGVTYELLLSTLNETVNEQAQKVLISAVMANANSIGDWLNGDSGIDIQGNHCLPTVKSIAFASWQTNLGQLHYIDQENESERGFFVPRVIRQINLGARGRETKDRLFPAKGDNISMAAYLGVKLSSQGPVAIFCGAKSTVLSISNLLVDYYSRGLEIPPPSSDSDQNELDKISRLSVLHFGELHPFSQAISFGVLPHSANVPNGIRVSVEWAMENDAARLVVCTSTLAQGVNLPIKYLIVSSTFQGQHEISTRDFHNLIGRAGRAGYHTEGSIIFADTEIYDKKSDFRKSWKWQRAHHLLDFNNAEDCISSLMELITPFKFEGIKIEIISFIEFPKQIREQCINLSIEHEIDISSLLIEMDIREDYAQAIESYFLSYLKDNPDAQAPLFTSLAEKTLAYLLAEEDQKELLKSAFEIISRRVLEVDSSKYPYFGKALLGIEQLLIIELWIAENVEEIRKSATSEKLLEICWPLIEQLNRNNLMEKIQPANFLQELSANWIAGSSYSDLLEFLSDNGVFYQAGTQKRKITIDHVIAFADGAIGFDAMLFVGALADLLEGQAFDQDIVDNARFLQSRLKLGLSSELELWLYSKGYVDREICKKISLMLVEKGVQSDNFSYSVLDTYSAEIDQVLSGYPTYFAQVNSAH